LPGNFWKWYAGNFLAIPEPPGYNQKKRFSGIRRNAFRRYVKNVFIFSAISRKNGGKIL